MYRMLTASLELNAYFGQLYILSTRTIVNIELSNVFRYVV